MVCNIDGKKITHVAAACWFKCDEKFLGGNAVKKRIVSMLLALTLVVSGMPVGITAEGVNAAESLESEALTRTEQTEDAVENNDVYEEEFHPEAGALYTFNVSRDGKAVGSDGVAYDDVAYLSADTVKALSAEGQSTYVEICDQIAEEKNVNDYLHNAVIAIDEDGNLIFNYSMSMKALCAPMQELAEDALEDATVIQDDAVDSSEDDKVQEAKETEELSTEEITEQTVIDDSEGDLHNETSSEENLDDDIYTEIEESLDTETSSEEIFADKEELSTKETVDNASEDEDLPEGSSDEEMIDATEENLPEEENETATEEFVLKAENMELVDEPEVEAFEIVENAKAEIIIDLGYNNAGGSQQFNSILPTNDYFSKQLTAVQKKIYNACKVFGKGTNKIEFKAGSKAPDISDIDRGVSAYVMAEPYKCDWIDWTKDYTGKNVYIVTKDLVTGKEISRKYDHTEISLPKSEFHNASIQKEANAKVLEVAADAQKYAAENYPSSSVYGIVKYFDKWICENHYYDKVNGTLAESDLKLDKNGNLVIDLPATKKKPYYYCHSSYGVLLENYGVCESYALAMTRLLDAVGIPNIYAIGQALDKSAKPDGGHAWNYIEMPDGKWYLQDSTWNEEDYTSAKVNSPSTEEYLLCADDTNQSNGRMPDGNRWPGSDAFTYEPRSASKYVPTAEVAISETEINLVMKTKKSAELTCENAYTSDKNVSKAWLSSNEKVVKVDQNGKITAVAPGTAKVMYKVAGTSADCKVNVHQINSLTFVDGGKASLTTSRGLNSNDATEDKTVNITLNVNQNANSVYTAQQLKEKDILENVKAESSKTDVATVNAVLENNTIKLGITPIAKGKTKITVEFGGKKATLNFSVMGEQINDNMFKLDEVKALETGTNPYTGKAYKPKVELTPEAKEKKVKFKVNYLNNKDAGTATVVIQGTGEYGGEIRHTFAISPLPLSVDSASLKIAASNLYNGGVNQAKSTVKNLNGTKKVGLKAGKDYDIMYKKEGTTADTSNPTDVGKYTMKIVGKGNYVGESPVTGTYEIKPNDATKVKLKVKVTGTIPTFTVAIGKNELPETDYELKFYTDKKCTEDDEVIGTVFMSKTQYFVKVVPKNSNISPSDKSKPVSFKTK